MSYVLNFVATLLRPETEAGEEKKIFTTFSLNLARKEGGRSMFVRRLFYPFGKRYMKEKTNRTRLFRHYFWISYHFDEFIQGRRKMSNIASRNATTFSGKDNDIILTKTLIPLVRHVIISSQSINQTVLFMS